MRWLRGGVHDGANRAAMFGEERTDGFGVANVKIVMLISAYGIHQIVTRCFGGSLRPEKLRSHVIIDAYDSQSLLRKTFRRFRTNQAG